MRWRGLSLKSFFLVCFLVPNQAFGQQSCPPATAAVLAGVVKDSTQAIIVNATVKLDETEVVADVTTGKFHFSCVSAGRHLLSITAPGFSAKTISITVPHSALIDVVLQPEAVVTDVQVDADGTGDQSANSAGPTQTISGLQLQSLADDPDDLLSELQQMAAAEGGSPANATIAVDGFQESVTLPAKSSIAYIKVNPDMFSSEYGQPPFEGGRIEIYTKPGQRTFHGDLFATNGSAWENARDPFSTSKATLGKQRYGFEFSGPVRPHVRDGTGSDFSLNLEHRSIDNFAVVDAYTLDTNGNTINTVASVPTPQRLWIGLARLDWQLGAKNTFTTSYNANVNHLANMGVGGATLADGGYDSEAYDHMMRFSDVTTVSARLMHEARLSLHILRRSFLPDSTATQVQVAGAFTGGGNTFGAQQAHKFITEFDDDAILTAGGHTLKFGIQTISYNEHLNFPTNFNGIYTFGGGTAPVLDANNQPTGQIQNITGIEQYRRALLALPGGTPTTYADVTGSPTISFTQLWNTLFLQDDWNVGHGLHIAGGLRYFLQTNPNCYNAVTPRLGVLWSPSKKGTWTLHAHVGLFAAGYGDGDEAEMLRENGTTRITRTIYNPVYGNPSSGAIPIYSRRELSPHLSNGSYAIENVGGTRTLPHGWNISGDYYITRFWNMARTSNINSPLNDSPTGPRQLGVPNSNILQLQNSAQGRGDIAYAGVEEHSVKRLTLSFGASRINLIDDNDDQSFFTAQSSFTNAGEFAHRSNQATWNIFGNGTLTLPKDIKLSTIFRGMGDAHYNITTGFDNNGDGDFNDRPQYAPVGSTAATPGVYATPFGLLVPSEGIGAFPRNKGVLPWSLYLDMNLQRSFTITRNPRAKHQQVITVNLRSSNVLNHLNVTAIGGVLGSPEFGNPYVADNGRRVEAGLRYEF